MKLIMFTLLFSTIGISVGTFEASAYDTHSLLHKVMFVQRNPGHYLPIIRG
jgi:hypothetical protein